MARMSETPLRARPGSARATLLGLAVLLLVGFGVRAWGIERYGLWIDEIATAQCLSYDLTHVLECRRAELGSPIFHVATNLVYTLAGRPPLPAPEWLVRLPELLAGTLTILAAWLATRALLGTRGAWLNAVLWTFAPTAVAYSQEARMYAWLMLFSNLSTWLLVESLRKRSWRWGVGFGVVAALNFYSHYLAVFVIAGQFFFAFVYILRKARTDLQSGARAYASSDGNIFSGIHRLSATTRRLVVSIVVGGIVLAALLVPWLPNILRAAQTHVLSPSYTREALTPNYFANAEAWIVLNTVETPLAALALLSIQVLGAWWLFRRNRAALALVACWLAVTFGFLVYRQAGFSSYRYWMVVQSPVYWLITAGGLALAEALTLLLQRRRMSFDWRMPYALVALVGILLMLPSLAQFYTDPFESYRFDDWRGLARLLRARARPNDLVIAFGDASVYHKMAFDFYLPPNANLPRVLEPNDLDGNVISRARTEQGRAWGVVYAHEPETLQEWRALGGDDVDVYPFKGLALVSPRPVSPEESVKEGTERLVKLYRQADPERFAFAKAILDDHGSGKNMLANPLLEARKNRVPQGWKFGASRPKVINTEPIPALALGSAVPDDLVMATQQVELSPAQYYILRFECRNNLSHGAQRTYVTFDNADHSLLVFPNGAGDVCANNAEWQEHAFVVRAPAPADGVSTASVILRNAGVGEAMWRNITLYKIPPP